MTLLKPSLALFYLIINFVCSHSQNSPQDYLTAHNDARREVNVGHLTWSNTLTIYALNHTNQRIGDCNIVHSGGPYGENIASSTGDLTAADAVSMWVNEKGHYDYDSNTCTNGYQCRSYIQVIWRDSLYVGCAKVRCTTGGHLVTCNYDPPGNIAGHRPY